jgi:hypothetical protein
VLFHVDTGAIPMEKCGYRKPVPKIVETWAKARLDSSESDLARKLDKGPSNHTISDRSPLSGEEKSRRGWMGVTLIPQVDVL